MLPNYLEYPPEGDSYPPHASSCPGQYLGATQSSNSHCDSDESQHGMSSSAANQDEIFQFFDFTLYDSDESATGTDSMSVVETSGLVPAGSDDGILAFPMLLMLPPSSSEPMDDGVPDAVALYRWLDSTDSNTEDSAVGLGSTENNLQWATVPDSGFFTGDHPESPLGPDSTVSLPSDSSSPQNDTPNKIAVPRMQYYICPTCKLHCVSRYRLREHLQQHHQPPRFICGTCRRSFQAGKDLLRHARTHENSRPFACSCNKSFTRRDSLQRHITAQMAKKPAETGVHKPV